MHQPQTNIDLRQDRDRTGRCRQWRRDRHGSVLVAKMKTIPTTVSAEIGKLAKVINYIAISIKYEFAVLF